MSGERSLRVFAELRWLLPCLLPNHKKKAFGAQRLGAGTCELARGEQHGVRGVSARAGGAQHARPRTLVLCRLTRLLSITDFNNTGLSDDIRS